MYSIVASGSNIVVTDIKNPNPAGQSTVATVSSSSRDLTWVYSEDNTVTLIVDGVMCTPAKFGQIFVAGVACTDKADFESRVAALTSFATSLSSPGVQPKVYRALLTQASTSAPVATVLENSLGGTLVWTRTNTGVYTGTLSGAFPANKVFSFASLSTVSVARASNNTVTVNSGADDTLSATSIEILVYP